MSSEALIGMTDVRILEEGAKRLSQAVAAMRAMAEVPDLTLLEELLEESGVEGSEREAAIEDWEEMAEKLREMTAARLRSVKEVLPYIDSITASFIEASFFWPWLQ